MSSSPSQGEQDSLIVQLCQATGLEPETAAQYLRENDWDLEAAANLYFSGQNDDVDDQPESSEQSSGPRTLSGAPALQPIPTVSSTTPPSRSSAPRKKFATLGDLSKSGHGGHGHKQDDEDDDDDDQDLFAGGEKSALAVQNPDDLKRKLLEKARRAAPRPGGDEDQPRQTHFRGTARTLGGDDAPSQVIEDPEANTPQQPERVERVLHFWNNGFSIDDGPLYETSNPQNSMMLDMIRRGRAPLSLMNIQQNQEVDVRLEEHDTPYQQPKKKYKPFGGAGQRLGSPVPGATTATTPAESAPANSETPKNSVDESQPSISLQIRLGDGTRLVSRFNTSTTVGDVYNFVQASNSESRTRNWILMTTFPSKELSDKTVKLGDTNELKKGGVVVQKWT